MRVGEKVMIWPNHACIAGLGFGWYFVVDGERDGGRGCARRGAAVVAAAAAVAAAVAAVVAGKKDGSRLICRRVCQRTPSGRGYVFCEGLAVVMIRGRVEQVIDVLHVDWF